MTSLSKHASLVAVAAIALLASACGGSASTPASSGGSTNTVSLRMVDGVGDVLVDSRGAALYSADQEAGGKILCTSACTEIWLPLTLPAGAAGPTGADGLTGKLGVVERPDGGRQVTFAGKPVYRFAEDGKPGEVSGNGLSDRFDGKDFTWHVVAPAGASGTSTGSGGYGY